MGASDMQGRRWVIIHQRGGLPPTLRGMPGREP